MGAAHPFRFGVEMQGPFPGSTWADSARRLESVGCSTLLVPDHFHQGLGPLVAMTAAALATTTLRVGTMVLNTDLRHPAVLARELATLDQLTGGRVDVGLGAGYNPLDYRRSGIPMDPPAVRVDRLIEHVAVLRALWAGGPVSFTGDHYRIHDLDNGVLPVTPGGPPILIGGGGPRMLRFAARHADIVGVNVSLPAAPDAASARSALSDVVDEKVALVREVAGDRFEAIELNAWLSVCSVTDDAAGLGEQLAPRFGAPADQVLASPFVLAGSVDSMVDQLLARRERWGYSYVVLPARAVDEMAPVIARLAGTRG